jgi:hypothetical protein
MLRAFRRWDGVVPDQYLQDIVIQADPHVAWEHSYLG